MNNISLMGRLTRDIEIKFTATSNKAFANFTLAVNRKYKKDGQQEADFISCTVWDKTAEVMAKHCTKGTQIAVNGRLQTRNYEDKDGKKVFITEVVIQDFYFCGSKGDAQKTGDAYEKTPSTDKNEMELPNWLESEELPF